MTWKRPVPVVGDTTSAAERGVDPTGWAFPEEARNWLREVIAARRDVRRFRPDPVPGDLVEEVLAAAHQAPSVGHSQPWRFIVVTEQGTRDRAALLADRERLRQADLLEPDRRARLLDLQLEGIREAPLGIVVACDRRTPAAGVLGRATFADTDLWSCACAIENLWLAARAAGLGIGWVTLFRPADLAQLVGLPDEVETLGWLCLGWPDERPPAPGLERHGWSLRLPLDQVVLAERWPDHDEPSAPVGHLAGPEPRAVVAARDTGDDLLAAPGSLGLLDVTVNRVLALAGTPPTSGTLVLVGAAHSVTQHQISAYPADVGAEVFAATLAGESLGAVTAAAAGLGVVAHWAETAYPAGDLVNSDAIDPRDVAALIDAGKQLGREVAADGLVCLGEVGIGNTTVAAALCSVLFALDPEEAVGLGTAADAAMLERKRDVVRRATERARGRYGDTLTEPDVLLSALGGPEIAFLTGVTLGAAATGTPVVLDGLVTSLAGLLAVHIEPAIQAALVAGQRSRERSHAQVLTGLGVEPLLDVRLRAGEGVGACLAAQILLTALAARRAVGRVR